MSPIWVVLAVLAASLAIIFEFVMARTETKTRQKLEQPLPDIDRTRRRIWRSLFFTTIVSLLFGLFLAGSHKQWTRPVQGVAIVIDTAVQASSSTDRLALEKAAAIELIRSLPGEIFSLWELGGGAVQEIVPPTVDRLFLEVQLDGLLPTRAAATPPTLASVYDAVVRSLPSVPPWVVCLTRSDLPKGRERLDGIASITVSVQSVSCKTIENGIARNSSSIEETGAAIARRLARAFTATPMDATESWLLTSATLMSLLCCLMWRRAVPPIAALIFICSSTLGALSPASANNDASQAIDIANSAAFSASEGSIDALLTITNDPQARGRLLYDRALLAYLQGRDAEALQWVAMEPSTLEHETTAAQRLQGMALIRLVLSSVDPSIEKTRKEALAAWIHNRPSVDPSLIASASMALIAPPSRVSDIDSVRRSLFWLEESAQDGAASDMATAAELLTFNSNTSIERHLESLWSKGIANSFLYTTQGANKVSALRIWYDFASTEVPDEGISFLLRQASMSAQTALYFPLSSARADLSLASSLLSQLIPCLPKDQQPLLKKVLLTTEKDPDQRAAEWYARATLWPALAEGKGFFKPLALILFREADTEDNPLIRQSMAALARSILPLPSTRDSSVDSLEDVVRQTLSAWYEQDPIDALDSALRGAALQNALWTKRLAGLLTPVIRSAVNNTEPLTRAVAEGVGGALPQTDVALSARVWQIAISPCTTPQDTGRYIDHLAMLFSELSPKLASPDAAVYRSLVLLYSVQPFILEKVQSSGVFQKNPAKRALYDQLLSEWEESCSSVQQRLIEPVSFRLPRVQQDVEASIQVLHRLQELLREGEPPPLPMQQPRESLRETESSGTPSVHGDDAVRLFQEMDRSDRSL